MTLQSSVTLRVFSEDLPLKIITSSLGEPSEGFSKGDQIHRGKVADYTYWELEFSSEKEDINSQLDSVLQFLDKKKLNIEDIIAKCEVSIAVMLDTDSGQGSANIKPLTLKRIASHGIGLFLDFYN